MSFKIFKYIIVVFFLFLLGISIIYLYPKEEKYICFSEKCFEIEIADTDEKRQKGLMFRKKIDKGMLFVFDKENYYSFWMKNTLIPLDIIWVNSDLEIVHIEHAVPCRQDNCISYKPLEKAKYVVEFPEGFVEKIDIKLAQNVTLIF